MTIRDRLTYVFGELGEGAVRQVHPHEPLRLGALAAVTPTALGSLSRVSFAIRAGAAGEAKPPEANKLRAAS